ncbi:MAG TPA: hypothetical protein DCO90_10615 [Sphingobacterium sp.]|nr:hypothetical protein [Sphingobacterium sp.]
MKTHVIKRAILTLLLLSTFVVAVQARHSFIENIGQVTDQYNNARADIVAKYAAGNGLNIFLANTAIHYQFSRENELYRMDVKLIGANPNARISKEKPTAFKEQYRLADIRGVASTYEMIVYHDIYPNVDWVFYFNATGKLEHDFVVRPGGRASDIKLEYLGANSLRIDRNGNLIASTDYGTITEPAPYSYDQATNKKVTSSYVLNGNILGFETGKYNGNSTLIIDPVIDWSTYLGGSEYDDIRDTKIGKDGFVYVVGSTNSTTNIATVGAHLTSFQGGNNSSGADAFIAKFSPSGVCVWSTYFGGSNVDLGLALAIDTTGYLYIAGRTNSLTGIATTGSYQETKAGTNAGYDVYLVKFDTAGMPVWGTYYGGSSADGLESVVLTIDRYNNLYLAGNTQSANQIATANAFQATRPGNQDGFIAKFNTAGALSWATYFGTSTNEWINAITTDTFGNIIVAGQSQGTTGLSTAGAYQQIGLGLTDGFIAKFDSSGARLWSSYFGGPDNDRIFTVCTDSTNAIYIGGITNSTTDIATSAAHQINIGSATDGFVAKFDHTGNRIWSTYFGGTDNDLVQSLLFSKGKLYTAGSTLSPNNITTPDAIVPVYNNSFSEGFLSTFSAGGQRLWSTYFGGDVTEEPRAIAMDAEDQVYIGGKTTSINGLATAGSHQNIFGGLNDGMLIKIKMCNVPGTPTQILGNIEVCANAQQQYILPAVSGADSYAWILPTGWTGTSSSDTINVTIGSAYGVIKAVAINSCGASDTISLVITVKPSPHPTISRNGSILSVSQTFTSYQWLLNGNPVNGATGMTHVATENGAYTLQVQGDNGCIGLSNAIAIDDLVSVDNLLMQNGIRVYPNPFSSKAFVETAVPLNIVVVDITGKVMLTKNNTNTNTSLDLSSLPVGNFYFKMFDYKTSEYLGTAFMVKTEQ